MKKEYDLVIDYDADALGNIFYTLHIAISQNNTNLLNLEQCQIQISEAFRAIALRKRFDQLNKESNTAIKYSREGFMLHGHKFETLDEVERAWKMKAFL